MKIAKSRSFKSARRQQGAVLFVGLMLLILMALLGLAGMQSTTLQERMAGNYRNYHLAFQNAESVLRTRERTIRQVVSSNAATTSDNEQCAAEDAFDRQNWIATQTAGGSHTGDITTCTVGYAGISVGTIRKNDRLSPMFRVLGLDRDNATSPTSTAVIETVFIP